MVVGFRASDGDLRKLDVLTGATGLTASDVLRELLAQATIEEVVEVRRAVRLPSKHNGGEHFQGRAAVAA